MGQSIQVIIPTYGRPEVIPVRDAEIVATPGAEPLFVVHESDLKSLKAVRELGADYVVDTQPPSGVNAANAGYRAVVTEWFVLSQDDIKHHHNWLAEALLTAMKTGAKVVGLNGNGGTGHAVAWLIHRPYVQEHSLSIGEPNVIFNPGYTKNYADNELNDTAKARGVFAFSENSFAEHLHPGFNKSALDDTYMRPEADLGKDLALFTSRRHLWS